MQEQTDVTAEHLKFQMLINDLKDQISTLKLKLEQSWEENRQLRKQIATQESVRLPFKGTVQ